ncbi:MAG: hypothetical protein OEY20_08435 [Gemmatimonadota bacterium]|nr:hypothetical protein [Gemmatimonadota bacterium]MDH5197264.1 hypothetical protein [Gemmatimonadota bacterium]
MRVPSAVLLVASLGACVPDLPQAPLNLEVTLSPTRQWVGAPIEIRSPDFAGMTTQDIVVTTRASEDDAGGQILVATSRVDEQTLAIVAWGYSGTRTVTIDAPGFVPVALTFTAVGQVPPIGGGAVDPLPAEVLEGWTPIPETGRVLASGDFWQGSMGTSGYALLNLRARVATPIEGLSDSGTSGGGPQVIAKLLSPGASARPDHFLFDFSAKDSNPPVQVWRAGPGFSLTRAYDLPCRGESVPPNAGLYAASYATVELRDSVCLTLANDGTLLRNGSEVIWADTAMGVFAWMQRPRIAVAPNGRWATVLGATGFNTSVRLDSWPVVTGDGRLAYTLDRFAHVHDAEFSADGDTLFVLAQSPSVWDSTIGGWQSTSWIEAIASGSGTRLAEIQLPDYAVALLADRGRPWLFALGSGFLAVVDRRDWTLTTWIRSGCYPSPFQPRALVLDGDVVHAIVEGWHYGTAVCHFDIL